MQYKYGRYHAHYIYPTVIWSHSHESWYLVQIQVTYKHVVQISCHTKHMGCFLKQSILLKETEVLQKVQQITTHTGISNPM